MSRARALMDRYLRLLHRLAVPRHRIGLNVFRVVTGSLILVQYLLNYSQRHFLFGPSGAYPWDMFISEREAFSLYQLSNHPAAFELLFHTGIGVTLAWTWGFKTRLLTPLTWLFWFSLRETHSLLWDGGDNLMQLALVYACFADLSPLRAAERERSAPQTTWSTISGLVHNGAVLALGLQVCLLYGVSGLAKVQGEPWQNGTALYYALWPEQYRLPGVSEYLVRSAPLLAVLSHATVFFQVAFPFLFVFNRYTRHLVVLVAIMFHLGIAGVMGLFTFAGFMIATDLALIGDAGYLGLNRLTRRSWQRLSSWTRSLPLGRSLTSPQTSQ